MIAIIGCGGSCGAYLVELAAVQKDRFSQVWAINDMCRWVKHDLGIIIDDIDTIRADCPQLVSYMETADTPYVTSRVAENCSMAQKYPLDRVISALGDDLLNNVGCYALALAIAQSEDMTLYGLDYAWDWDRTGNWERGGQAVGYLIGLARSRGLKVNVTMPSSMLDTNTVRMIDGKPRRKLYGYAQQPAMGHLPPAAGVEGVPL